MPFPESEYPSITRGKSKRESQRMLAAAPAMLEALKACVAELEQRFGRAKSASPDDLGPLIIAREAIAVAEGRL